MQYKSIVSLWSRDYFHSYFSQELHKLSKCTSQSNRNTKRCACICFVTSCGASDVTNFSFETSIEAGNLACYRYITVNGSIFTGRWQTISVCMYTFLWVPFLSCELFINSVSIQVVVICHTPFSLRIKVGLLTKQKLLKKYSRNKLHVFSRSTKS